MKARFILIVLVLISINTFAQNAINYKALIKDANGNVVASSPVSMQFIIYEGAALTNNVYQENHTINTDGNGFVIVNIGEGATSDDFTEVKWRTDEHYLNVQIDIGNGLVDIGTTQFMAVPYALSSGDNQWVKNTYGINTSHNAVGINSSNPEHTLDVRSASQADPSGLNISNSDKSRYLRFFSGSETYQDPSVSWAPNHNFLFATFDDNTLDFNEYMRISSLGDVGIGIADPEAKLDIKGGDWNLDAGNPGDLRIGDATHNLRFGVATGGGGAGITRIYATNDIRIGINDETTITIEPDGETGFGTTNPSQKVEINGKLKIGDDATTPSEGTVRYNSTEKSFEGYDGTKWIKLGGSSPYGMQGTFNLPNSSFSPNFPGNAVFMIAAKDLIAIRSAETITTYDNSVIPPIPIIKRYIYVNMFKKNTSSDWVNVLSLTDESSAIINSYAEGMALSENRFLVGDPDNNLVREYNYYDGFWWTGHVFESPDTSINDRFGASVAMYVDQTIIGAPAYTGFPSVNTGPGRAYVYDENDILEASLGGPGATLGDRFGSRVDIALNRAIVGAPGDSFGSVSNAGSATIFNRLNGNWSTNNTFFDDTIEEDEYYGAAVILEDADNFFIYENDGYDAYLIEDGFWVLKETIIGEGSSYEIGGIDLDGNEKMIAFNRATDGDKIDYLVAKERDVSNLYVSTSSIINGTSSIKSYEIVDNAIYTLGSDDRVYIFEY